MTSLVYFLPLTNRNLTNDPLPGNPELLIWNLLPLLQLLAHLSAFPSLSITVSFFSGMTDSLLSSQTQSFRDLWLSFSLPQGANISIILAPLTHLLFVFYYNLCKQNKSESQAVMLTISGVQELCFPSDIGGDPAMLVALPDNSYPINTCLTWTLWCHYQLLDVPAKYFYNF